MGRCVAKRYSAMVLIVPKQLHETIAEIDGRTTAVDEFGIVTQLMTALDDPANLTPDERRGAFAEIEAFRFQRPHGAERRVWGIYWGELASWVTGDGKQVYSPDIANVDEEVLSHWIIRSANAQHPALRARFSDLSWEIGRFLKKKSSKANKESSEQQISVDVPVSLAHRAIDAYLEVVELGIAENEFYAWQFLDRAIELSITINDPARIAKAKVALFRSRQKMEEAGGKFMWWRFDDITWERAKALDCSVEEKQTIIATLENALVRTSGISNPEVFDPHWAMGAADRLTRRFNLTNESEKARHALKVAAAAFEEAAKGANALVALSWLEDLIPRYRNAGMLEDAARVEQTIRSRANEAQGEMKRVEVPVNIPKEELEGWADRVAGSTIDEAISNIATACLIRENSTRESIENILKNAPLVATIPSSIMGEDGFTKAKVGSINDDLDGRAVQHAANLFNWHAPWLYFALNRAREKHGFDLEKLVAAFSESPFFAPNREPLLKEGLAAWISGDPVKAIHVLVPQLEAALRDVLAALGAPVMTRDPHTDGFKAIGMGAILDHQVFRGLALKDMRFHLRALLCDPRGINLRNHLAHGLVHPESFGMGLANWVIHSLLLVRKLRIRPNKV